MKYVITQKLQAELAAFGLNPAHWVVIPRRNRKVRVQHKTDKDFCFQGQFEIKSGRVPIAVWKSLELAI